MSFSTDFKMLKGRKGVDFQSMKQKPKDVVSNLTDVEFKTESKTISGPFACCLSHVTPWVTLLPVIRSFRHKELQRLFEQGVKSGVRPEQASRLRLVLGRLHASTSPKDMNLPGLRLHELKGERKGAWSVMVSGNWRITFRFEGKDAVDVVYEDYH